MPSRRRNYTSVANEDIDIDNNNGDGDGTNDGNFHDEPAAAVSGNTINNTTTTIHTASSSAEPLVAGSSNNGNNDDDDSDDGASPLPMSLTILDSAQKKFPIPCDKTWTVGTFKRRSAAIHKVAPPQQRLIFRGRMLTRDDETLEENKLDESDLIVHLFPKPRVVVTTKEAPEAGGGASSGHDTARGDGDTGIVAGESGGAHVPSIVIDQEEQDRRGQILVLGSVEIAESQNNVKMLSLLLIMICAMRLLALLTIATGAAEDPNAYRTNHGAAAVHNDTGESPHNGIYDGDFTDDTVDVEYETRSWQTPDWFDLVVSAIGLYVGTLGMKATQHNTFSLATAYAIGTVIAGIGWNLWNVYEYVRFYEEQNDYRNHDDNGNGNGNGGYKPNYNNSDDDLPPLTRDDFITVAFFTILLPLFVWFLCCVRAFEFRRLLREAEEEASERIRNEYVVTEGGRSGSGENDDGGGGTAGGTGAASGEREGILSGSSEIV